jgi:DNA-binding transcriptional MocR family regulator
LPALGPRLHALDPAPVSYSNSGPLPELIDLARERLAADRVAAPALTVTNGALDAIERLLTAHLRPGDRVGVEDPGWANLIDLVAALSLEAVPVPVDDEGPTVDGLRRAVDAGIAALVVTSRAHNPTGASVSPERAAALRPVIAVSELLVIEDDHAAELAEVPLAPLAGAGTTWAFVRSVSKPYGPDLRVAVVAGDEATIARVEGRMRLGAGWVSTVLQRLVVALWTDVGVAEQVARAKVQYRLRREGILAALAERGITAHGRTGINVWLPVEQEAVVVPALLERGYLVSPGAFYRQGATPAVRLSIGALPLSEVDRLADAVASVLAPRPGAGLAR